MNLKEHVLGLQRFENAATEKAGLRCRLLDETALVGKDGKAYARGFAEAILGDIQGEIKAAAELGMELGAAIDRARSKEI